MKIKVIDERLTIREDLQMELFGKLLPADCELCARCLAEQLPDGTISKRSDSQYFGWSHYNDEGNRTDRSYTFLFSDVVNEKSYEV